MWRGDPVTPQNQFSNCLALVEHISHFPDEDPELFGSQGVTPDDS